MGISLSDSASVFHEHLDAEAVDHSPHVQVYVVLTASGRYQFTDNQADGISPAYFVFDAAVGRYRLNDNPSGAVKLLYYPALNRIML